MNDLINTLGELSATVTRLSEQLNLPQKQQRLEEITDLMQQPDFWDDQANAQALSQEHSQLTAMIAFWSGLPAQLSDLQQLVREAGDESSRADLETLVTELDHQIMSHRQEVLLSGEHDNSPCILGVHAGAGGSDAQDWADMLLRMLLRYCDKAGLRTEVIELHRGQEAGIKSALVQVQGLMAYGLLKSEAGVHRLVRLSPFNPAHTRETSFALIEALPLLPEKITQTLDPKDLVIEATTSSGHGGQSVNTTYSAIRMTHKPTGLKVSIQNERSQHQNKELALKILTSRVRQYEKAEAEVERQALRGEFKSAEWGNQIRSYVLHPYKMVKDHRTGYESSDPDSVLNGELQDFVTSYLEFDLGRQHQSEATV